VNRGPTVYDSGEEKQFKIKTKYKTYKFEKGLNFKYLGVVLNEYKSPNRLTRKNKNANKTYFMLCGRNNQQNAQLIKEITNKMRN
jgi:hypothetical protein